MHKPLTRSALHVTCLCRILGGDGDKCREAPLDAAAEENPPGGKTRSTRYVSPPPSSFHQSCELTKIHFIMCWDLLTPGLSPREPQRLEFLLQKTNSHSERLCL